MVFIFCLVRYAFLHPGFLSFCWNQEKYIFKTSVHSITQMSCLLKKHTKSWSLCSAWIGGMCSLPLNSATRITFLLFISRRQRGRLKLCSKSILFDPKDTKYPILKVRILILCALSKSLLLITLINLFSSTSLHFVIFLLWTNGTLLWLLSFWGQKLPFPSLFMHSYRKISVAASAMNCDSNEPCFLDLWNPHYVFWNWVV